MESGIIVCWVECEEGVCVIVVVSFCLCFEVVCWWIGSIEEGC